MLQINQTEIFRERQLELLREAEDRRLARQLREASSQGHPRSEGLMAEVKRAFAMWGRTSIPYFRA